MFTSEIKSKIDRVWEAFWTGGITNPLSVIEQVTYLLFIKGLDDAQTVKEQESNFRKQPIQDPIFKDDEKEQNMRWKNFKNKDTEEMFKIVRDNVYPFIQNLNPDKNSYYARYMKKAVFLIPNPKVLSRVVELLDDIPMKDRDTKGDIYEYLLSKLQTAGKNGQFRTPQHIRDMMVQIMKPTPTDIITDPASGSAGFLVSAGEYLRKNHRELFADKKLKEHFNNTMFYGYDIDETMLRIGAMNMVMHGIENPHIEHRDSLEENSENYSEQEKYTLVLANPPFTGTLDKTTVRKDLQAMTNSTKTELLFLALFLKMLKNGGRAAVIVPDGVMFGSSNAHKAIRKEIIDNNRLEAVISMPSGVFKPYAGVSTAILIFTKTSVGGTDNVWFYDMKNDGYSLDDKRNPIEQNDIPDILERFEHLREEFDRKRTEQSFLVPVEEIISNEYDLSINRYKEVVYEEVTYEKPKAIIGQLDQLEKEIMQGLNKLGGMIDES